MAYYDVEPFGEERADLRNGTLISSVERMFAGEESKSKPGDFVLQLWKVNRRKRTTPKQTAQDQIDAFSHVMKLYAGSK